MHSSVATTIAASFWFLLIFKIVFVSGIGDGIVQVFPGAGSTILGTTEVAVVFEDDVEVKKVEATLWQDIQGKKKSQKLKLKEEEDDEVPQWRAQPDLVDGEACLIVKVSFKTTKKKTETNDICFMVTSNDSKNPSTSRMTEITTIATTSETLASTTMVEATLFPATTTKPNTSTSSTFTTQTQITSRAATTTAETTEMKTTKPTLATQITSQSTTTETTELKTTTFSTTTSVSDSATTELVMVAPAETIAATTIASKSSETETPSTTHPAVTSQTIESPLYEEVELVVAFTGDKWPAEFEYSIVDEDGNTILERRSAKSTVESKKALIATQRTYCFRATDSFGDGICCEEGNGNYEVSVDGKIVLEGGQFWYTTGTQCFHVNENGSVTMKASPPTEHCEDRDEDKFNMCIDIVDLSRGKLEKEEVMEEFEESFLSAKKLWSKVLKAEVGQTPPTPFLGLSSTDADLFIEGAAVRVDGEGKVLAFAGPRELREDGNGFHKPIAGIMAFDYEDVNSLIDRGILYKVIAHEISHVLGLGTLWEINNLYHKDKGGIYLGTHANREYRKILEASGVSVTGLETVPVEQEGGSGTAHGHFSEACLTNEIMTGWIESTSAFSAITIGALEDLGYTVSYSPADPFEIANPDLCTHSTRRQLRGGGRLNVRNGKTHRSRLLHGQPKDEPSPDDEGMAIAAGKKFLRAAKTGRRATNDWSASEIDEIEVVYEGSCGNIFAVAVFADDLGDSN